jgi:hypothetical protein
MDDLNAAALGRRSQVRWDPWRPDDVTRLLLVQLAGVAMMAASWFEASGQLTVRGQLTWLNLGLVGLLVSGVGNGIWLLQGRRNVGTVRALLLPDPVPQPAAAAVSGLTETASERVVVTDAGATMYHRPGCQLIEGKPTETRAARHDQVPCQVCQA